MELLANYCITFEIREAIEQHVFVCPMIIAIINADYFKFIMFHCSFITRPQEAEVCDVDTVRTNENEGWIISVSS